MAFHLGSLGFLTPFKFEDFETQVKNVSCFEKDEGSMIICVLYCLMRATRDQLLVKANCVSYGMRLLRQQSKVIQKK